MAVPSDRNSVRGIADAARRLEGPVYIRLGQTPLSQLNDDPDGDFSFGGARLLREGTSVTVCTCGIMGHQALKAADILDQQGIDIEILDFYSLKPFPEQALLRICKKDRLLCCSRRAQLHRRVMQRYGRVPQHDLPGACKVCGDR